MSDTSSALATANEFAPAKIRLLIWTSLFTALTVLGGQMRVPLPVVPVSAQTLFVLLSGGVLGPCYGAASQLLYLLLGLAGLPVFAKGGGLAYVLQPTFGYLLGFPLASYITGALLHGSHASALILPKHGFGKVVGASLIATATLLLSGVVYLWWSTNLWLGGNLGLGRALWIGAALFLPGDLLKAILVGYLYSFLQPHFARRQSGAGAR